MKVKAIVLFLLLMCVLPSFAGGDRESSPAAVPGYTGVVQYLEGRVTMNGEPLSIGDTIIPGATITTGEGAYCEILFGEKNIFRIMESTVADISIEKGRGNVRVAKGAMAFLLNRLSALESENPEFMVETPSSAFGVRGTAFFVAVESPVSSYVCACNGSLQVQDANGENTQELTGYRHKALRIEKTASGTFEFSSPGLLYHTDDDMNGLADRIDETIPWGSADY